MSACNIHRARQRLSFATNIFIGVTFLIATAVSAAEPTSRPHHSAELTAQVDSNETVPGTVAPRRVAAPEPVLVRQPAPQILQASPTPVILFPRGSSSLANVRQAPDPQTTGVAETSRSAPLSPPVMVQPFMRQERKVDSVGPELKQ